MAAHRYWAIEVTARVGAGNGVAIAEVEMRGSAGGADLCAGGTAGGSFTTYPPANAFDNNNGTHWYYGATGGLHTRLSYDFGAPVTVAEMMVRVPGAGAAQPGATYGPAHGRVVYSDDGTNWSIGTGVFYGYSLGNDDSIVFAASDAAPPGLVPTDAYVLLAFTPPARASIALPAAVPVRRWDWGGTGKIEGTVKIKGTPNYAVRRKVYLLRDRDMAVVDAQWSDPTTGAYSFVGFDPAEKYTVISYDYTHAFRAVIADNLTPEAM